MRLNLGCGKVKLPGYVNIDVNPAVCPDRVMDLRDPIEAVFGESTVDAVYSSHFLEHLDPAAFLRLIEQLWRISKPGAVWEFRVPHEDDEIGNPYHRTRFTEWTFRFFETTSRFTHPVLGPIYRGTAHEMSLVKLRELSQKRVPGEIRYRLEVVK